jgi:DNA-binding IclR family transcriptional regulator
MPRSRATKGVAAVNRALAVLDAFSDGAGALTLRDIAARTRLHKSTILRLIESLKSFGHMIQLENGSYRLGPTLFHLGYQYHDSFRLEDHVMPALRELARATEESASFYIREGDKRICLFRVESPRSLRDHIQVGEVMPLTRGGAAGRVLVAFSRVQPRPEKLPVGTVGALTSETAGLSIPIFGRDETLLGALTLSGPRTRFTKVAVKSMSVKLLKVGDLLTRDVGGDPRHLRGSTMFNAGKRNGSGRFSQFKVA